MTGGQDDVSDAAVLRPASDGFSRQAEKLSDLSGRQERVACGHGV